MAGKKNVVLFLGAGASKSFGIPLTNELLPLILQRIGNKKLFGDEKNERDDLESFLFTIMGGLSAFIKNSSSGLPLITDLLSVSDYMIANAIEPFPMSKAKNMVYYRHLLEKAVLEILAGQTSKRAVLQDFVTFIYEANHRNPIKKRSFPEGNHFSIITTNYDSFLDLKLFGKYFDIETQYLDEYDLNKKFDFGIPWRDPEEDIVYSRPTDPWYTLLKLHGSTNWLKCDVCGNIYVHTGFDIYDLAYGEASSANKCHCSDNLLKVQIVAPSFARSITDPNLLSIWKGATELLRTADEWIIIGYSMPPEDLAMKAMFMRAFAGRAKKPKVVVIQYEPENIRHFEGGTKPIKSANQIKYELFFNSGKNEFEYHYCGLGTYLNQLKKS